MGLASRVLAIGACPLRRKSFLPLLTHAFVAFTLSMMTSRSWAIDLLEGRVQVHGDVEEQLRMISNNFHTDGFYMSQWANVLNVELELNLAPQGWGPFSEIHSYARVEVRYDCVWTKLCGLSRPTNFWGDRAGRAPKNFTDAEASGFTGILPDPINNPEVPLQANGRLLPLTSVPPLDKLVALGGSAEQASLDRTFGPVNNIRFALKKVDGTLGPSVFPLGPWNTGVTIVPIAALANVHDPTPGLPLRPVVPDLETIPGGAYGLFVPSEALREKRSQFGSFDQNFTQNQLAWNYGASQDTYELKESYIHFEMLDGRLWFRLGKQTIVWGKTELFRNQDQFNPTDFGLTSLGTLDETRIPLWAARAVYSFYNVGPLEDVQLEVALDLDKFKPNDLGRCGEPYTIFLVCAKSAALVGHGVIGVGLAGEIRPPNPYDKLEGLQGGARIEFRWDRYSFAITDYYGYSDFGTANNFNAYQRNVDPFTGHPLDSRGSPYGPNPDNVNPADPVVQQQALNFNAGNRQLFDVFCSATVGLASGVKGLNLGNECALTLISSQATVPGLGGTTVANVISDALAGGLFGRFILQQVVKATNPALVPLVPNLPQLNPITPTFPNNLDSVLTTQQQALLGCGPFYGTRCSNGIDLFNSEASVLLQAFPMFEPGGPVATRVVGGALYTLPGACGPFSCFGRAYDPRIDGCVSPTISGAAPAGFCLTMTGTHLLAPFDPGNGSPLVSFNSEMQALSYNLLQVLTILSKATDTTGLCDITRPQTCSLVAALFSLAGTQRPELRAGGNGTFGRRDFLWLSGAELDLQYPKRNILGFAMDFANDATKSNWGVEFSWSNAEQLPNGDRLSGFSTHNTLNLTVSMDRPTFINFLNANRTFFFNTQWFTRYINGYQGQNWMAVDGPFSLLGTLTVSTGYFQDRLLPSLTFVHDVGSTSGAGIMSLTYRYSEVFSMTLGLATFYGTPHKLNIPIQQAALGNNGPGFDTLSKYDGLSALAERDEVSMRIRYTF